MDAKTIRLGLPELGTFAAANAREYLNHYSIDFVSTGVADEHIMGQFKVGAYTLVGQGFINHKANKNALIVHGYMDHTGLYGLLIQHLLTQQYNVFMCDLPGHGLSSGKRASIKHFFEYTDAIYAFMNILKPHPKTALPWYLLGQSMGGAISMSLLKQQQLTFNKTVLFAPLVQPKHWSVLKHVHSALKNMLKNTPRKFVDNSHDAAFNRFLKTDDPFQTKVIPVKWITAMREWRQWLLSQPASDENVLIIQGTDDTVVDWQFGTKAIADLFSRQQLRIIKDARHHMINESPAYLEPILQYTSEFLDS